MLNSVIINGICTYLNDHDIVKFHKITNFDPNLQLWKKRYIRSWKLIDDEISYFVDIFNQKYVRKRRGRIASNLRGRRIKYACRFYGPPYFGNITLPKIEEDRTSERQDFSDSDLDIPSLDSD
jgi:hypothetical protein